jgi:hypothetical protein
LKLISYLFPDSFVHLCLFMRQWGFLLPQGPHETSAAARADGLPSTTLILSQRKIGS